MIPIKLVEELAEIAFELSLFTHILSKIIFCTQTQ